MDRKFSKLREIVEDRGVCSTTVHEVAKSQTWLSDWTKPTIFLWVLCSKIWNQEVEILQFSSTPSLAWYCAFFAFPFIFRISLLVQFSSVTQSCLTFSDPMDCSTPDIPVHHQLPEFRQTHVHWVGDAIQPSHLLSPLSPPALNLFSHQSLFQWVSSSHQVAKVLELQLQHQSY